MKLQIIKGDLLLATDEIICHQVNCRGVMGSGVAKALYTKWPEIKSEYHKYCNKVSDPFSLLGKIQEVRADNGGKKVINIFGQLNYGKHSGVTYTSYPALLNAFTELNKVCAGKRIAFPHGFGCGLAGGDWAIVERLMCEILQDCYVTVYMKGED